MIHVEQRASHTLSTIFLCRSLCHIHTSPHALYDSTPTYRRRQVDAILRIGSKRSFSVHFCKACVRGRGWPCDPPRPPRRVHAMGMSCSIPLFSAN